MVAGVVNPPALDLANEDLIRSHLQAVWLGETGQRLGPSVQDVLDREKFPALPLTAQIAAQVDQPQVRQRAAARGIAILGTLREDLTHEAAPWFTPDWLDHTIKTATSFSTMRLTAGVPCLTPPSGRWTLPITSK
jgi:hypothetical protein